MILDLLGLLMLIFVCVLLMGFVVGVGLLGLGLLIVVGLGDVLLFRVGG